MNEISTPRTIVCKWCFSNSTSMFLGLNFQIIYQYPRSGSTEGRLNMTQPLNPFLPINFKDKSFHSSIERSGIYFQKNIPTWFGKTFRFTVFNYWKMHLWKTLTSFGMIWSLVLHVEQPIHKSAQKESPHEKHFLEKIPLIL